MPCSKGDRNFRLYLQPINRIWARRNGRFTSILQLFVLVIIAFNESMRKPSLSISLLKVTIFTQLDLFIRHKKSKSRVASRCWVTSWRGDVRSVIGAWRAWLIPRFSCRLHSRILFHDSDRSIIIIDCFPTSIERKLIKRQKGAKTL